MFALWMRVDVAASTNVARFVEQSQQKHFEAGQRNLSFCGFFSLIWNREMMMIFCP